jgi:hypothetical protein
MTPLVYPLFQPVGETSSWRAPGRQAEMTQRRLRGRFYTARIVRGELNRSVAVTSVVLTNRNSRVFLRSWPLAARLLAELERSASEFSAYRPLNRDTGERELVLMRWVSFRSGPKDPKIVIRTINAKAETITTAVVADRSPINGPGDLREETQKWQDLARHCRVPDLSAVEMSEKTLTDCHHPERD